MPRSPRVARELLPPRMLLGVFAHGLEEAKEAADAGADHVAFGHVYPTPPRPDARAR